MLYVENTDFQINIMKKLLSLLVCCVLVFASCTTENNSSLDPSSSGDTNNQDVSRVNDMLYGMCYIQDERENYHLHVEEDVELMYNLGVGCTRNWMHCTTLLKNKVTPNREVCDRMHACLAEQQKYGIKLIGMNHTNFNNGTAIAGKPKRDISEGSYYTQWLRDYYTTWLTLAKEFPEVEYWEIDNEVNNADFMKDLYGNTVYNLQEMADIVTDMLFYASRAIHSANKKAQVVLGGITEPAGLGHGENVAFLELLYQNILSGEYGYFYGLESKDKASTDPDDYFEIACWHPYVWNAVFDPDHFVRENDKIYDVILKYEPEGKDVFFTEIGFHNEYLTEEQTAYNIRLMLTTVRDRLPYVKTVTYFKMFDVAKITWTGKLSRYGLFYDPHNRPYTQASGSDTTTLLVNGAPKLAAYAFQEIAGGSGSLNLLCDQEIDK